MENISCVKALARTSLSTSEIDSAVVRWSGASGAACTVCVVILWSWVWDQRSNPVLTLCEEMPLWGTIV